MTFWFSRPLDWPPPEPTMGSNKLFARVSEEFLQDSLTPAVCFRSACAGEEDGWEL